MIFKQNKKYTHLHSVQRFSRPALNAWFVLLEHQRVFESSLIVTYESLSRPWCENLDLHIIVIVGKGSNTQKCCKTKELV